MYAPKKEGLSKKELIMRARDIIEMEDDFDENDGEMEDSVVQPKLEINSPGDQFEQHADEVANKLSNNENASELVKNQPTLDTTPQKNPEAETPGQVSLQGSELQTKLDSTKGGGQSLDDSTKTNMEQNMGVDLSDVKIHTDSKANELSEGVNAKAFAYGQDIYFKSGNYSPNTSDGKNLLGHELAHTQQQKGDGVQRKIQRKEEYKPGENLQSIWFKDIPELEKVFDGTFEIGLGASGLAVQRIQLTLLEFKRALNWSPDPRNKDIVDLGKDGDDSHFGPKTQASLIVVQKRLKLKPDGVVGRDTLLMFDSLLYKRKQLPVSYNEMRKEALKSESIPDIDYFSEGKIGATKDTYQDILTNGKKVYDYPNEKEKFRIKYGEKVSIYAISNGWFRIHHPKGQGWIQKDYVKEPLPKEDEDAALYFVKPGDTIGKIAQNHYASINEDLKDARLIAYAIALENMGRTGVKLNIEKGKASLTTFDKATLADNGEKAQAIWRTIQVTEGSNIWLPSELRISQLEFKGVISSGSKVTALIEDLNVVASFVWGFIEGVVQSVADFFVGIYELGKLAVETTRLFSTPQGLMEVYSFLKELKQEDVIKALKAVPAAIAAFWSDIVTQWNNPDKYQAAEYRGKVIGYLVAEIVLTIITEGIFTEVKWVSFVLSKLGKTGELLLDIINAVRKPLGKEMRAAKYAEEVARIAELNRLKEVNKAIKLALKSSDSGKRLEGKIANLFIDDVIDFNKKIPPGTGSIGEIDIELATVIIEVTESPSGKLPQIKKLLTNSSMNPSNKSVILYAPNYGKFATNDIVKEGVKVAKSEAELLKIINDL